MHVVSHIQRVIRISFRFHRQVIWFWRSFKTKGQWTWSIVGIKYRIPLCGKIVQISLLFEIESFFIIFDTFYPLKWQFCCKPDKCSRLMFLAKVERFLSNQLRIASFKFRLNRTFTVFNREWLKFVNTRRKKDEHDNGPKCFRLSGSHLLWPETEFKPMCK